MLFEQGDPSDLVYVVEEGAIEVFRRRIDGGEDVLTAVRPPDYFGEIGPLLGLRRAASARALEDTVLTGYGPREFSRWMGGAARAGAYDARPMSARIVLLPGDGIGPEITAAAVELLERLGGVETSRSTSSAAPRSTRTARR